MNGSPAKITKQLQNDVDRILRPVDVLKLARKERDLVADLKQALIDAVIYTNAYELSETEIEALGNAKHAKRGLSQAQKHILSLSEIDMFNPIDVAHLSAVIGQAKEMLVWRSA